MSTAVKKLGLALEKKRENAEMLIVDHWPGHRPFIGGSSDNSVQDLIVGYNGLERVEGFDKESLLGIPPMLLATICYAASSVMIRRFVPGLPAVPLAAGQLAVAAATLIPLSLLTGGYQDAEFWVLAALVLVGELFPIQVHGQVGEETFSTPFAFALLLVYGLPEAAAVQVAATVIADLIRRRPIDRPSPDRERLRDDGAIGWRLDSADRLRRWNGDRQIECHDDLVCGR